MAEIMDALFDLIYLIGTFIIFIVIIVVVPYALYRSWYKSKKLTRNQEKLLSEAKKYNELCKLISDIRPYTDRIEINIDTLSKYQKYNYERCLSDCYDVIKKKYEYIHSIKAVDKLYNISSIPYSEITWIREREQMLENEIDTVLKQPVTVSYKYVSSAGRRYYFNSITVTEKELNEWLEEKEADRIYKESEQYKKKEERGKLTPGLRYDILKRDNFKCQICGRTQSDGITLEVDHKIPIAKGGKTEPDNLWTLCRDCNRGKSDKYDGFDDMKLIDKEINTDDYYIEI